jgi:hypothetical protein
MDSRGNKRSQVHALRDDQVSDNEKRSFPWIQKYLDLADQLMKRSKRRAEDDRLDANAADSRL